MSLRVRASSREPLLFCEPRKIPPPCPNMVYITCACGASNMPNRPVGIPEENGTTSETGPAKRNLFYSLPEFPTIERQISVRQVLTKKVGHLQK